MTGCTLPVVDGPRAGRRLGRRKAGRFEGVRARHRPTLPTAADNTGSCSVRADFDVVTIEGSHFLLDGREYSSRHKYAPDVSRIATKD